MRVYEDWLEAYIHHQRYSESPLNFHFWTGVATIAGALQRKCWINELHFTWTPNMYIVLVGPPGVAAKSTTMQSGLSMLERVPGVQFGPQSMTWQALIDSFKRAAQGSEYPDQTTGELKTLVSSCLTIGASELGTFLDPNNKEFMDLLTDMWDCRRTAFRRETVGRGAITISNPWLNIIGCTTPSWLKERFPEELVGGGLTSRIVFVYGDRKRQLVAYPSRLQKGDEWEKEEEILINDLIEISKISGQYKLEEDAYQWGESWYKSHNNGAVPTHMRSGRYDGYLARKQAHIHKLGTVLAASKRSERIIKLSDLLEAEKHISDLEPDMRRVFDSIGVSEAAKVTDEVIKIIRSSKTVTSKDLWRMCINTMDPRAFQSSILAAEEAGLVKKEKIGEKLFKLTWIGPKKEEAQT